MSLKKWKNEFSKREFVKLIKNVANKNLYYFNYTKKPYLMEKQLPDQAMMAFCFNGKHHLIAYDYAKFKRAFGKCDYTTQYVYAVQYMAHEMRHYYQERQIRAHLPDENKKSIENWKNNSIIKTRGMEENDDYKYWFSSRELDANLYSYIFTFDHLDCAGLATIWNKRLFNVLKKLYKQNGGKNARKYFSRRIKKSIGDMAFD